MNRLRMRNKGGGAISLPPAPAPRAAPSSGWTDPVFRWGGSPGGSGSNGLPWWLSGIAGVGQRPPSEPQPLGSPGYQEYGPGTVRPDAGPDAPFGAGANPYGTSQQPGSTDVSAGTMGNLFGAFGAPTGTGRLLQWYADRYGDSNPYDTATPQNTGPVYYGPSRAQGANDEVFGENFANDWANEGQTLWGLLHPSQGIGAGGGMGGSGGGFGGGVGGGGARDPYAGTANPWDWGGPGLR